MQKSDILKIHGWMVSQRGLHGNELLVFAICFMLREAESEYTSAMAKRWLQAFPRTTVLDSLQTLFDKKLISQRELDMLKDLQYRKKVERKKRTVNPETLEAFAARRPLQTQKLNSPSTHSAPPSTKILQSALFLGSLCFFHSNKSSPCARF